MEMRHAIETIAAPLCAQLPKGAFLCVGGPTPNVMTIGWGGLAYYWQRDVFVAPVRPQRFTHGLLQKARTFTVSVPAPDTMAEGLRLAGTLSGRDGDKFKRTGLVPRPGREVPAPIVEGCAFYLECRTLALTAFTGAGTEEVIRLSAYPADDFHSLFHGEIVACYFA